MQPADATGLGPSNQLRRWGPLALIAVLLVAVGAVVVVDGGDEGAAEAAGSGTEGWSSLAAGAEPGAPEPTGRMPATYAEAEEAGEAGDLTWPDICDIERGRLAIPSVFATPCVPAFEGDNGGATSRGVTADTIRLVYYAPEISADLASILGGMGANDTPEQRAATLADYVKLFSSVAETYGRTIEVVPFAATGAPDDVVAARADATDVLELDPFAVVGAPALDRGTFAQEVAGAGVLCFECAGALPDEMVLDMAPYIWSTSPTPDQYLGMLDAWTAAAAGAGTGDVAAFAGDGLRGRPRRTGVIHFEQDPPLFTDAGSRTAAQDVAIIESYLFDLPAMPAKAAELIARFKAEGITTIMFLGDPFMPGYLTAAATEQDYHPEWIFAGTALTDTNILARTWDQTQMARAYGISQLAAPSDQDLEEAVALYRWYYGGDDTLPPAANQYGLLAPPAARLVAGIHMAGPDLTPETFARGLFRIPPAGGGPANPQVSYGNWGVFPQIDYQAIDDAVEIWWDPTVEAEDERGAPGTGVWRRSHGGERFTIEEAPPPRPFTDIGETVTVLDRLPSADTPPDYPPPPGAPAAG